MQSNLLKSQYNVLKCLGEGSFGRVYLVEDHEEERYAVKEMNKVKIGKNDPEQLQYIYNEVNIMKELKNQYIVRLYKEMENDRFLYLIMEFCNGGDLKRDQTKQPNMIYSIETASQLLSGVIRGLEIVHRKGFLHRDIKLENILISIDENERKSCKIADFGLSKMSESADTVLGTANYMSPEIYKQETYGFEVDMWAFGVVLFFMLNKDFPFRISPHIRDIEFLYNQLMKQASGFSYKKSVADTKLKLLDKCTPELEDLFSKIFELDTKRRITFSEIRVHPIFKKHFPDSISETSSIMYQKNMRIVGEGVLEALKNGGISPLKKKPRNEEEQKNQNVNLKMSVTLQIKKNEEYPKQKNLFFHLNEEIQFLWHNFEEFKQVRGVLTLIEKIPLCYNLIKYYIILKKHFISEIKSGALVEKYPKYKIKDYLKTKSFKEQFSEINQELNNAIFQFDEFYSQCKDCIEDINKINNKFQEAFTSSVVEKDFEDPFKRSYRKSTLYTFEKLKKFLKDKTNGNKFNYFLAHAVICHVFNRIFKEKENVSKVFREFLERSGNNIEEIDYGGLREWMSGARPEQLNAVTKNIISKYFES